ncbi:hypothetical protein XBFFL1_2370040 [Xenorhabdus bovienii str. feltiae Florida]|uniref:Uncharacterized protein n=2 Tax=Xenorhabdus bovienii TaxID=40576 RepID=A0A0B6X4I4_XENBV|nr:hypothetical protein XBFFR1_1490109 [Xenorhabdus bovienii str. feltiae France]CDG92935.1 hypothetical protein XBFFL1_2370040 [Xenorhabdus bovienii str. feltiae Florida]CDH01528.1 hypothetical protein XBFM1_2200008 [Xenorhabdus bovienii str. feltiae Moldova]CDM88485.1 protein of unknown function [Xenorhabdus bovienii]
MITYNLVKCKVPKCSYTRTGLYIPKSILPVIKVLNQVAVA